MRITREAALPAGVEDAFAVVESQDYQEAKVEPLPGSTATVTRTGDDVVVQTTRVLPTAGMPGPVVSMVGDTLRIDEQQTWHPPTADGSRHADIDLTVAGVPLRMRGTIDLSPAGAGSRLAFAGDLTCSIPLMGKKVEQAAQPAVVDSIDAEVRLLTERLA
ncbi:DUF2505 domain-containing protein [Janibacter sp. CX7]|jgi:hypothetical protein|uniref:DUF2505 domain-containing protein n=1 Tax=Janibacter sp. CX7 TaxID=2963431 RepID=UPI0020CD8D42|nr:DUF2505 domain-containing protein [Janibacter sp. CX7]UTT65259.1 DUF2505 domain-containing protein [Janibacter sp. CX7]